jgi:hypothetical protein
MIGLMAVGYGLFMAAMLVAVWQIAKALGR